MIPGYLLVEKLGQGGMGEVFKARQLGLDRWVAIKIMNRALAEDREYVQRFLLEARTAGRLRHENIVSAIDCGEAGGRFFMVMEFVEGGTAQSLLKARGRLPELQSLEITRAIAEGLQYAWENGIIHRDVKPQNILLDPDGVPKLCDLGLCRDIQDRARLTASGTVYCTPQYASPEQSRGDRDLDTRTDIYSLGVSLYELTTGKLPFEGDTPGALVLKHALDRPVPPREKNPHLSARTSQLILHMMEKSRDARPATPGAVARKIAGFLSEQERSVESPPPIRPQPAPSTRRSMPPARGRGSLPPFLAIGGAVTLGAILLGVLISIVSKPAPRPVPPSSPRPLPQAGPETVAEPRVTNPDEELFRRVAVFASQSQDLDEVLRRCEKARERLRGTSYEADLRRLEASVQERKYGKAKEGAPAVFRELAAFATDSQEPDAILLRCDAARATLKGTEFEAELNLLEEKARERKRTQDQDRKLVYLLEEIRQMRAGDPSFVKRTEVRRLLRTALEIPGPRRGAIQRSADEYEDAFAAFASAGRKGPHALGEGGSVDHWLVIGPFPGTSDRGLFTDYLGGDRTHVPKEGSQQPRKQGGPVRWLPHETSGGKLDFREVESLGLEANLGPYSAYSACWLKCEAEVQGFIQFGCSGAYRLWLDHAEIGTGQVYNNLIVEHRAFPVTLSEGWHLLLIKAAGLRERLDFVCRLVATDGAAPPGVQVWK
jgi:serine/threonine protein kinase